jgi:hypothetical protein
LERENNERNFTRSFPDDSSGRGIFVHGLSFRSGLEGFYGGGWVVNQFSERDVAGEISRMLYSHRSGNLKAVSLSNGRKALPPSLKFL